MPDTEMPTYYVQGEISGTITNPLVVEQYENDYEKLVNKPKINGVELTGDKTLADFGDIVTAKYLTMAEREAMTEEESEKNKLYVWTDYTQDQSGKNVYGISIGDGTAKIGELPIIAPGGGSGESGNVTPEDRANWNAKVKASIDDDTLVFTT